MSLGPGDKGWEAHTLFSEYGGKYSTRAKAVGHSPTRTSRLRSHILKLSCYLNGEADRGRATICRLPLECDTLGEVLPKIHKRLDLDKRIAYAAELFLPDGTKIKTYQELEDAAENDHAIIVGCGMMGSEPYAHTIPTSSARKFRKDGSAMPQRVRQLSAASR